MPRQDDSDSAPVPESARSLIREALEGETQRLRERVQEETSRQLSDGYPNPVYRYRNDANFHSFVDMLRSFIRSARFTPTELREAVILAAIIEEQHRTITPFPSGDRSGG